MHANGNPAAHAAGAAALAEWLDRHPRVFVLTGAGCSTASGIPDYRDRDGQWKRAQPVTFQALTGDPAIYRRYWARSCAGWPRFAQARPNGAHAALAMMETRDRLSLLVTQNVDGLHQRAGNRQVLDLHGRLDAVVCLGCGLRRPREAVQAEIEVANPGFPSATAKTAPDGDADLDDALVAHFHPPACRRCGGMLKPDVVFFGEPVPRGRVETAREALLASDAMLVAGSSLMVYSGFRFARMASEAGIALAILNRGHTRADALAQLKVDDDIGATLQAALT